MLSARTAMICLVGLLMLSAATGTINLVDKSRSGTGSWNVVLNRPELLFDTSGVVESVDGLKAIPQRPQKMGQVIASEHPWENGIYFYGSVVEYNGTYMLYYGCNGPAANASNFLCLATSSDGVSFTKPLDVGVFTYNGSSANNIVWETPYGPDGHKGTGWSNSVYVDTSPGVPASERFKLLYDTDAGQYEGRHLLIATSPDGINFSQLKMSTTKNGSLVAQSNFADTNTAILWIKRLEKYVLFGRYDGSTLGAKCFGSYGNFRQVAMIVENDTAVGDHRVYSSKDISNFTSRMFNTRPHVVMHNNLTEDPPCVDYYNPAPIDYCGVTFIFPSATRHLAQPAAPDTTFPNPSDSCRSMNDGFLDIRLGYSRLNLLNGVPSLFTRLGTKPVVSRGIGLRDIQTGIYSTDGSEWDAGMVFMCTGLVALPSEPSHVSSFYFGSQFTHGFEAYHLGQQYPNTKIGYGRLKWRQEGIVALSTSFSYGDFAANKTGTLVTKPIVLQQPLPATVSISLNIETSVSGQAVVEILNAESMQVLPGWTSLPAVGNSIRLPVVFNATLNDTQFSCDVENDPNMMPKVDQITVKTDITSVLQSLASIPFRLRITLEDAHIYSLTFV